MPDDVARPERQPQFVGTGAGGGTVLPNGDVVYQMSGFMRWGSVVAALLFLPLVAFVMTIPPHPEDTSADLVVVGALFVGLGIVELLAGRGWIRVTDQGVLARNIVTQMRIPWTSINAVATGDKVGFDLGGDQIWWCWAVQRANTTAMLGRASWVDRVAAEIEARRQAAPAVQGGDSPPSRTMSARSGGSRSSSPPTSSPPCLASLATDGPASLEAKVRPRLDVMRPGRHRVSGPGRLPGAPDRRRGIPRRAGAPGHLATVGFEISNAMSTGAGNDFALDHLRVVDVTSP